MKTTTKIRFAGVNFDHMHMGDLLRMVHNHPHAEIVGICDETPSRMIKTTNNLRIPSDRIFTDYRRCIEQTKPDVVILCPATAKHAEWTQKVASFGVHILMEKPFAASLAQADAMIHAVKATGKILAINWPLRWYPSHTTAKRLVDEGVIGDVIEVHYYDGNRGPCRHGADKKETAIEHQSKTWFYQKAAGGGSLHDYLGYGVTLGTWFNNAQTPIEVMTMIDQPQGLEVDEHSITLVRYDCGLSKFETRWGSFTDPWTHQPQPKCGFVLVGRAGTIGSYDYEKTIRVQTEDCPQGRDIPVDEIKAPYQDPIQYMTHCLETGTRLSGPLAPEICRIGQQIIDSAVLSAEQKQSVPLIK